MLDATGLWVGTCDNGYLPGEPLGPLSRFSRPRDSPSKGSRDQMIVLGLILLIVGFIAKVAILWTIGIILLVVGLIFVALGATGRAVGGRRHYY